MNDLALDQMTLERAAFELLSSSTVGRFVRKARENADRSGLAERAERNTDTRMRALARAGELWKRVATQTETGPEAIELAVLLASIEALPAARGLVSQIAKDHAAPSQWIPASARHWQARWPHRALCDVALPDQSRRLHRELRELPCI